LIEKDGVSRNANFEKTIVLHNTNGD